MDDEDVICIACDRIGRLNTFGFQQHMLDNEHFVCMRMIKPMELYCSYCGDYRYFEEFDRMIGNKRPWSQTTISTHSGQREDVVDANGKKLSTTTYNYKGICNMGSTCFMSSVLQVLMRNPVIRSAFNGIEFENCIKNGNAETTTESSSATGNSLADETTSASTAASLPHGIPTEHSVFQFHT